MSEKAIKKTTRCGFYAACRGVATAVAYHTFLKKTMKVCASCLKRNPYLEKRP